MSDLRNIKLEETNENEFIYNAYFGNYTRERHTLTRKFKENGTEYFVWDCSDKEFLMRYEACDWLLLWMHRRPNKL